MWLAIAWLCVAVLIVAIAVAVNSFRAGNALASVWRRLDRHEIELKAQRSSCACTAPTVTREGAPHTPPLRIHGTPIIAEGEHNAS